jgi:hypothetical protein
MYTSEWAELWKARCQDCCCSQQALHTQTSICLSIRQCLSHTCTAAFLCNSCACNAVPHTPQLPLLQHRYVIAITIQDSTSIMICAHASQALPRFPPVVLARFSISLTGMVRNKAYAQGWRLRINMGNVFFEQKKYSSAIKMYRMALDNVPSTSRGVRLFPTSAGQEVLKAVRQRKPSAWGTDA